MQIQGSTHLHGPQSINAPHQSTSRLTADDATSSPAVQSVDQLDISEAAQAASESRESAPIRFDRVAEIRAQIADGTYDTADKLDLAIDRLMDDLA